jgi:imidazole glycerol phosphate synthase subunit HisF
MVFLDISATEERRKHWLIWFVKCKTDYIPFTVGGGISSVWRCGSVGAKRLRLRSIHQR